MNYQLLFPYNVSLQNKIIISSKVLRIYNRLSFCLLPAEVKERGTFPLFSYIYIYMHVFVRLAASLCFVYCLYLEGVLFKCSCF